MSKADLYKYHKDPRYNPSREVDLHTGDNHSVLSYDDVKTNGGAKSRKIKKKIVNEKTAFFSGKL